MVLENFTQGKKKKKNKWITISRITTLNVFDSDYLPSSALTTEALQV